MVFGVQGDQAAAWYEHVGSWKDDVEKEDKDKERYKEIVPVKMKTKCSSSCSSRSTGQWMATKFLSNLGVVFYWTIPGINLNDGQSKLCIVLHHSSHQNFL